MIDFLNNAAWFGTVLTLAAYVGGLLLQRRFKLAALNPLLLAAVCVIGVLTLCRLDIDSFQSQTSYFSGLLTPATVCLAVPLYEKLTLLKKHWKAVLPSLCIGAVTSCLCVWGVSELFGLSREMYVSLLPKSITTAIGMGVAEELGGSIPITVAAILISGVSGSVMAQGIFKLFGIREPVARGLAMGASSHAIGTARAMEMGEVEGAMSSLAIVVTGLLTVVGIQFFALL